MSTLDYYNQNASAYAEATIHADMSAAREQFLKYLPQGARILDLGCGSGRDSLAFLKEGYDVLAVDGSEELCHFSREILGDRVRCVRFENLDYNEEFDGVWACASLLHVPKAEISGILRRVSQSLKPKGILNASFKYGTTERIADGRHFSDYDEGALPALFGMSVGFILVDYWISQDVREGREGEKWINVIAKKESSI